MGAPVLTTLSSVGVSRAINLDWMAGKYTTFSVTGSSSGAFTFVIEATADDLQATPAASVAWFALSSATTANSSLSLYQGPLGGIRVMPARSRQRSSRCELFKASGAKNGEAESQTLLSLGRRHQASIAIRKRRTLFLLTNRFAPAAGFADD